MRRNVRWCSCWVVGVAASHDTVRDAAGDDDDGRSAAGGDDAGGAEGGGGDAGRRRGDEAQEATNPPTKRLSALTRALSAELLPHSSLSLLHRSLLNRYPTSRMNESGHQIMKLSVPSKGGFIEACYCAVCRAGPQMADTASVRHRPNPADCCSSSGLRSEPSCTNGDVTFHRGASSCRRGVGVSSGAHDRALAPCRSRDGMVARSGGMNHLIV